MRLFGNGAKDLERRLEDVEAQLSELRRDVTSLRPRPKPVAVVKPVPRPAPVSVAPAPYVAGKCVCGRPRGRNLSGGPAKSCYFHLVYYRCMNPGRYTLDNDPQRHRLTADEIVEIARSVAARKRKQERYAVSNDS